MNGKMLFFPEGLLFSLPFPPFIDAVKSILHYLFLSTSSPSNQGKEYHCLLDLHFYSYSADPLISVSLLHHRYELIAVNATVLWQRIGT